MCALRAIGRGRCGKTSLERGAVRLVWSRGGGGGTHTTFTVMELQHFELLVPQNLRVNGTVLVVNLIGVFNRAMLDKACFK